MSPRKNAAIRPNSACDLAEFLRINRVDQPAQAERYRRVRRTGEAHDPRPRLPGNDVAWRPVAAPVGPALPPSTLLRRSLAARFAAQPSPCLAKNSHFVKYQYQPGFASRHFLARNRRSCSSTLAIRDWENRYRRIQRSGVGVRPPRHISYSAQFTKPTIILENN